MNRGYALGVGIGLLLFATAGAIYYFLQPPPPLQVAFTTRLVNRTHAPVPYHQRDEVVLKLRNQGRGRVRLDALRFNLPFVQTGQKLTLPLSIPAGATVAVPVEITSGPPDWGQQAAEIKAILTNGRETGEISTAVLWDIAAHINPDPPLVNFPRVKRTGQIAPTTIRLWHVQGTPPPVNVQVQSLDPAVRVSTKPLNTIAYGRHHFLELLIEIDAGLAQPQHRSQIVVRSKGSDPPIIIPIVGWVDE